MTDKAIHFASLEEIVRTRPDFDPTCVITRDNFKSLVSENNFDKDALCQVESIEKKDRPCRNKHRIGWLGKRQDDKEGLIGSTCGPKYFEGHEGFSRHRATVRRELELDDLLVRLQAIATDSEFPARVDAFRDRLRDVRAHSQSLLESLPDDVIIKLRSMAKAQDATLRIEVEFIEKVEDARTKKVQDESSWLPHTAGSITGLNIANREPIHQLGSELAAIHNAFESLDTRRELGIRKLRVQLKVLDQFEALEAQVAAFEALWVAFGRPENLGNLWLLSRRDESQIACMRASAVARGLPNPSNNYLRQMLKDAEAALRANNGNRRVRPA